MKRIYLTILAQILILSALQAQLSTGGYPQSFSTPITPAYVPVHTFALPDWDAYLHKQKEQAHAMGPAIIGLLCPAALQFPAAGTYSLLPGGEKLWSAAIAIEQAPALSFYFDRFHLPEGVRLYIINGNKRHILGAYTAANNNTFHNFVTEAIQGSHATLELNIPATVPEEEILLSVNNIGVYFTAIDHLKKYAVKHQDPVITPIDLRDSVYFGGASVCAINAICPIGADYPVQRQATLQHISIYNNETIGVCSGTMVNHLGDNREDCKQYYLTAAHCENSGLKNDQAFSQFLFRFQYETTDCTGLDIPESKTLTGAKFCAQSNMPSRWQEFKGDFLLLDLKEPIPANWGIKLNGWNAASNIPLITTAPQKFINFGHPGGDVKKVSVGDTISSFDMGTTGSHWNLKLEHNNGIIQGGVSGSGLFDGTGQLIGIASIGTHYNMEPRCTYNTFGEETLTSTYDAAQFSKLSYVWNYTEDGNNSSSKLKPWLDPDNKGVLTAPTANTCYKATAVQTPLLDLSGFIHLYPNPVTGNTVSIGLNFRKPLSDLIATIYDINGRKLLAHPLPPVQQHTFNMSTETLPNGVYVLRIYNHQASYTTKLIVNK